MRKNKKKPHKEFPCKEPGCPHKVVYEPDTVIYAKKETVYLTCPIRHTHPYEV